MLLLIALACVNGNTSDELNDIYDRLEALELAANADKNRDGLRDADALPVGTKRGDVLWSATCTEVGSVHEMPAALRLDRPRPMPWTAWRSRTNVDGVERWELDGAPALAQQLTCSAEDVERRVSIVAIAN